MLLIQTAPEEPILPNYCTIRSLRTRKNISNSKGYKIYIIS